MPAKFVAEISFDQSTVVITLKGVLDGRTSPCLETVIDTIVDRVGGLAFDVTELWSLDSMGYDALCRCIDTAKSAGTPVTVRGSREPLGPVASGLRFDAFPLPNAPMSRN